MSSTSPKPPPVPPEKPPRPDRSRPATAAPRQAAPASARPARRRPSIGGVLGAAGRGFLYVLGTVLGLLVGLGRAIAKDRFAAALAVVAVILATVFFALLGSIGPSASGSQVALSEVLQLSRQGQITQATLLDHDHIVEVRTENGNRLWAAYPSSGATSELVTRLSRPGVQVAVDDQAGKGTRTILVQFLLPILLLVVLFALLTRVGQGDQSGGLAAFSKWTGRRRKKGRKPAGALTFANVAGAGEAIVELREIRDYLADPEKYRRVGARSPKGVLLVGPPGTGKTLLAKATAGEADAAFFSLSGSEFVESLVGVGAARVRDLFKQARAAAPAIIFIDEIDAAGRKRGAGLGQGNDEREQTLNQLLVEMDGFDSGLGLVVMAATNRPDILDPALLRPGRFDRQVTVDVPDVHGRADILRLYVKGRPLESGLDMMDVAKLCPGFSGAELANVVNEAALLTVRQGRTTLKRADFEEAIDRVVAGPAKKAHILTAREKWVLSVHEAAHAVAARSVGQRVAAQKLSIVARGRQLGTAAHMLEDRDQMLVTEPDLWRQLVTTLAGTAGEDRAFGTHSTGVHDDLHAASAIARSMVTSYGMSPEIGPVTIGEKQGEVFLGASLQELGSIGPATLDLIDRETERIVREAHSLALEVLGASWGSVIEVAKALMEQETLSGVALEALLAGVHPYSVDRARGAAEQATGPIGGEVSPG